MQKDYVFKRYEMAQCSLLKISWYWFVSNHKKERSAVNSMKAGIKSWIILKDWEV